MDWAEAYVNSKCILDPSRHLATIYQRYSLTDRQDRPDRQRSDSTGRTVLQTVAQQAVKTTGQGEKGRKGIRLAATLRWFTAGGAIRIAHYDVIDDVITRKL